MRVKRAIVAVPGRELRIGVSCGLATFPDDADDAVKAAVSVPICDIDGVVGRLVRQADGRMYAAKAARRGGSRGRQS